MQGYFQELWEAIVAFNQNGVSHIAYMFTQNWWFLVIAVSAILTMTMQVLSEIEGSTTERHDIA